MNKAELARTLSEQARTIANAVKSAEQKAFLEEHKPKMDVILAKMHAKILQLAGEGKTYIYMEEFLDYEIPAHHRYHDYLTDRLLADGFKRVSYQAISWE